MRIATVRLLACPACRIPYRINEQKGEQDTIVTAVLTCPRCCVSILVLNGFPIFDEQHLTDRPDIVACKERLFGRPEDYEVFVQQKRQKPVYDLYAAFQPFNESTQCIFPLVPLLREVLKPGDRILDLWCRTGWTGELLASLFPQQQVLSIWEGSSGLLGLKGFHYWLGSGKRRNNLEILFHHPNHPLPFPDGTFAVAYGLDTLHRYRHVPLLPECLRVVRENGLIVFPHNHLTNSQPEPYFDRGEDQLHGTEYVAFFERLLKDSDRKAFILSEKTLFEATDTYSLSQEAETRHYNACVLLTDARNEGRSFQREDKTAENDADAFAVVNPLWNIDLVHGSAIPAPEAMDFGGKTLFFRHPIYFDRLKRLSPVILDETDRLLVYWALRLKSISEIASLLRMQLTEAFDRLKRLEACEILQVQNVSFAMARLQYFYSHQDVPASGEHATLPALWSRAVRLHGRSPYLIWPQDDSVFSYSDADRIVRMAASFLQQRGVREGDRIAIDAISHPEFVFLFWAAILLGAVAAPLQPKMKAESLSFILRRLQPRLIFIDPSGPERDFTLTESSICAFGVEEDTPAFQGSFSQEVAECEPVDLFPSAAENQEAVILFTSGSTGMPKGVVLSHGGLYRTARIVNQSYGWRSEDRFLSGGGLHTMSGLRNPCIAPLHSGSGVVLAGVENTRSPLTVMDVCQKYSVTILNVTPAFLAYWSKASGKAKYYSSHQLRVVLSTGSSLQPVHREAFESSFHCPVFDYYGLTETTGACILQMPEGRTEEPRRKSGNGSAGLGIPVDCLVRILDKKGESMPPGHEGELAVYSDSLMLGYLGDEDLTAECIRDGWLLTGDIAYINESGCVILAGRKDRMMIDRNGENVYPEEIEKAIADWKEVADSYVMQVQNEMLADQIAAVVQFHHAGSVDPEEQISKLRTELAKRIAGEHVPSIIIPVTEIPKGPAGKPSSGAIRRLIQTRMARGPIRNTD